MINYFIFVLVSFISTFGVTYFYCKLCNIKPKINLFIVIWIILGSFGLAALRIFDLTLLSTFAYFVFYPILFYSFNKISLDRLFFYVVIIWFCGIILDILSMFGVLFLKLLINFNIYSYLSRIILTFIVLIMFIFLGHAKRFKKIINSLFVKVKKINFFDFALVAFAIFVILVGMAIFLNLDNLDLSILLMAIILLKSDRSHVVLCAKELNLSIVFLRPLASDFAKLPQFAYGNTNKASSSRIVAMSFCEPRS